MVILTLQRTRQDEGPGAEGHRPAGNLTNVEQVILATAPDNFGQYGVEINKISGLTISLPDEVQKAMPDQVSDAGPGVDYLQYQAGQAMTEAAKNQSGVAGVGAGLRRRPGCGGRRGRDVRTGDDGRDGARSHRSCPNCGSMTLEQRLLPDCGAAQTVRMQQHQAQQQAQQQQPPQQPQAQSSTQSSVPTAARPSPARPSSVPTAEPRCRPRG